MTIYGGPEISSDGLMLYLDERYVQISNLDTSLNFVSGIASEYDVANKVLNVFHDDTCPTYNDSSRAFAKMWTIWL